MYNQCRIFSREIFFCLSITLLQPFPSAFQLFWFHLTGLLIATYKVAYTLPKKLQLPPFCEFLHFFFSAFVFAWLKYSNWASLMNKYNSCYSLSFAILTSTLVQGKYCGFEEHCGRTMGLLFCAFPKVSIIRFYLLDDTKHMVQKSHFGRWGCAWARKECNRGRQWNDPVEHLFCDANSVAI